ncbi:MAG: hypothetical protein WC959_10735 [Kiritimatiellales bacterium]
MGSKPKTPKVPEAAPVAAPVTAEDESVRNAAEETRRRILQQQGRTGTFLVPAGLRKTLVGD